MNCGDLLCVALCNDNLRMFNQAWEETLEALGNELNQHVLENSCERQVKKTWVHPRRMR